MSSLSPSPVETCTGCGRALGEGGRCFFCGLRLEPLATPVREAVHRQGAVLLRFIVSSAVLVPFGIVFAQRGDGPGFVLAGLAFLLGPLPLAVQAIRRSFGAVRTSADGVLLAGHAAPVPWSELRSVEHTLSLSALLPSVPMIGDLLSGLPRTSQVIRNWNHKYAPVAIAISGLIGLVLSPLFLFGYFVVPAVSTVLPWHDRVVLESVYGERHVLHDLEGASAFVLAARDGMPEAPLLTHAG